MIWGTTQRAEGLQQSYETPTVQTLPKELARVKGGPGTRVVRPTPPHRARERADLKDQKHAVIEFLTSY